MANLYRDGNEAKIGDWVKCVKNLTRSGGNTLPIPLNAIMQVTRLGPSEISVIVNFDNRDYLSQRFVLLLRGHIEIEGTRMYRVIK